MNKLENLNNMTAEILKKYPEAAQSIFNIDGTDDSDYWAVYDSFAWHGSDGKYRTFASSCSKNDGTPIIRIPSTNEDEDFIQYIIDISEKYKIDFEDQRTWTTLCRNK